MYWRNTVVLLLVAYCALAQQGIRAQEEYGDLTDFLIQQDEQPMGIVRETLPAQSAGVDEMGSIDQDPTGPSVKAWQTKHGKESDPGGLLPDPEEQRSKLQAENGDVHNVVEVNQMRYAGHLNKKAKKMLQQSNPDMLDKSEADAENVDDTNYLKTAATSTDSVPEAHQLNEPTSGFGTATLPNEEETSAVAPPGTGTEALPVSEDTDNQGTKDPVGDTGYHPSESDTAPNGEDKVDSNGDDDVLLSLASYVDAEDEEDDDSADEALLAQADDLLLQLDTASGGSRDANVHVTKKLSPKEEELVHAVSDEYGEDGYRDTQTEVDNTMEGLVGLQGRIRDAINKAKGSTLSEADVNQFMKELVGVQDKLLGSYSKLQKITSRYATGNKYADLAKLVKKGAEAEALRHKAEQGSLHTKVKTVETADLLMSDSDNDDHHLYDEEYNYYDGELPGDVLAQIDQVRESIGEGAQLRNAYAKTGSEQVAYVPDDGGDPHPEDRHPHPESPTTATGADCHICTKALHDVIALIGSSRKNVGRVCNHLNGDATHQCLVTFQKYGVDPLLKYLYDANSVHVCEAFELCDPNQIDVNSRAYIEVVTSDVLHKVMEAYALFGHHIAFE